jgi:hypothetical protein
MFINSVDTKEDVNNYKIAVYSVLGVVLILVLSALAWQSGQAQAAGNSIYLPLVAGQYNLGPGSMSGVVLDGQTSTPVDGVTVCVTGTSNCSLTTGDGIYHLSGIPAGMTQFQAYPSAAYYPVVQWENVVAFQEGTLNFALSFNLSEGEYRVILTWDPLERYPGCSPEELYLCNNDLDANLWVPDDLDYIRIYWGVLYDTLINNCDGEPSFACIQNDAKLGNGPETILILPVKVGVYQYAVFDYAHAINPGLVPPITKSLAQVDVYGASGLLYSFHVPPSGTGDWWHVFNLDGTTKEIIPVNSIMSSAPLP